MGMFIAARALNRPDRASEWARRLELALSDDPARAHVDSAGFCHGAAGLALIAMRAAGELGDHAAPLARSWLQRTVQLSASSAFTSSDNPLLDGPAGIGLVLLSAISGHHLTSFELLGIPRADDLQPQGVRAEQVQCESRS
jgi:hypothetical protein